MRRHLMGGLLFILFLGSSVVLAMPSRGSQGFSVAYLPGEHGSGQMADDRLYDWGEQVPILPNRFAADEGYVFAGFHLEMEAAATWTLTYYSGYAGGPEPQMRTVVDGFAYTVPGAEEMGYGREADYVLAGWSLTKGGRIAFQPGDQLSPAEDLALYGVWLRHGDTVTIQIDWYLEGEHLHGTNVLWQAMTVFTYDLRGIYTYLYVRQVLVDGEDWPSVNGYVEIPVVDQDISIAVYLSPTPFYRLSPGTLRGMPPEQSDTPPDEGAVFVITGDAVLTATWAEETYTLTYDGSGGGGVMTDPLSPYTAGDTALVAECIFSPPADTVEFSGWSTGPDGRGAHYRPGDELVMSADVTLHAIWAAIATPAPEPPDTGNTPRPGPDPQPEPEPEPNPDPGPNPEPDPGSAGPPQLDTDPAIVFVQGYPDGTVRPEEPVTRADAAVMLARLTVENGSPERGGAPIFSDVPRDSYYYEAVVKMAALGLINGYGDGLYRPMEAITRAELTVLLARYVPETDAAPAEFADLAPDHWAMGDISVANALGWVTGYPEGTFQPESRISRAEAITLICRVLGRTLAPEAAQALPQFSDLSPDHWAYPAVMAAAGGGGISR